jgi:hypothetical protein
MSTHSTEKQIEIADFGITIKTKLAKSILDVVMNVYNNKDNPEISSLKWIIREHVEIPGFRKNGKSPPAITIRQAISSIWYKIPPLSMAVLKVWLTEQEALVQACDAWLENHMRVSPAGEETGNPDPDEESPSLLDILGESVEDLGDLPGYDHDEILLGLFIRMLEKKYRDEANMTEPSKQEEKSGNLWQDALEILKTIPPDDMGWNLLPSFFEAIQEIAALKLAEKTRADKTCQVGNKLDQARLQIIRWVDYLELENCAVGQWSVDNVSLADLDDVESRLDQLLELLRQLEELDLQRPTKASERARLFEERLKVEEKAKSIYCQMAEKLLAPEVGDEKSEASGTIKEAKDLEEDISTDDLKELIITETLPEDDAHKKDIGDQEEQGSDENIQTHVEPPTDEEVKEVSLAGQDEENEHRKFATRTDWVEESGEEISELEEGEIIGEEADEVFEQETAEETSKPPSEATVGSDEGDGDREVNQIIHTMPEFEQESTLVEVTPAFVNSKITEYAINNKYSKAYWLAWGLEHQQETSDIPSWLIAAIQGTVWQIGLWPELPVEFLDSMHGFIQPDQRLIDEGNDFQVGLGFAAGILMSMIAPGRGWESWLHLPIPQSLTMLEDIIGDIWEANHIGLQLDPNLVGMVVNKEQVEQRIQQYVQEAKDWPEKAKNKKGRILRASNVWLRLVHSQQGELYKLLECVAEDKRALASEVKEEVNSNHWRDRNELSKKIQRVDQEVTNSKGKRPIDGEALDQLINWILEACNLAEKWADAILAGQSTRDSSKKWHYDQTKDFCEKASRSILKAVEELEKRSNDFPQMVILRILKGFFSILTPNSKINPDDFSFPPLIGSNEKSKKYQFEKNISVCLLQYPELSLSDAGQPDPGDSQLLIKTFLAYPERTNEAVLRSWIESKDYRFVEILLEKLGKNDREAWEERIQEAFRSDAQELRLDKFDEIIIQIEQALLDALISESEYTDYKNRRESIRKPFEQKNGDDIQYVSIKKVLSQLNTISGELAAKRKERLSGYEKHWKEIKVRLPEITHSDFELTDRIIATVEGSLKSENLRVTGEYLAELAEVDSGTKEILKSVFSVTSLDSKESVLREFQGALQSVIDVLEEPRSNMDLERISEAIGRAKPIPGFAFPNSFPTKRRQEAARAIRSWKVLKKTGLNNQKVDNLPLVQDILEYLGFAFRTPSPVSVGNMPDSVSTFRHWRVLASSGEFSPVAQFGSLRNEGYDVIGVWDRPGIDIISSQVIGLKKRTDNRPTILLYFGRLGPNQRKDLLAISHRDNLPVIIIDEALILFLARQLGSRLEATFLCTLPYASINPYFPAAAGMVPPEVFKGRRDIVEKLKDFFGPAIVYGGRQLGKSALLRMVQREFHDPENKQFAIYEDIRSVGDPMSGKPLYAEDLVERISQALQREKFPISSRFKEIRNLFNGLQQVLTEKNLKLILLLDEADHFLDADSKTNFEVVQLLKNLMDQSQRRFKIIIAGLHNVQRFTRITNQPLAHLGTPIEIGPLEAKAAYELLEQPLNALGYRFARDNDRDDNSLILQILSYTNRHPGLIQLFGNYLVEHLRSKYQKPALPPFIITRADVEAVFQQKVVRDAIRDRFNWTLALDPRYEIIILSLILEQWQDRNGFNRQYTSRELWKVASSYWPGAFEKEEIMKGSLEELLGLGVLASTDDGKYRLRSPNLVYLMGTHDEIEERITSIVENPPPGEHAIESCHAKLITDEYSTLTFAQEQLLNLQKSGVVLFFGTPATGLRSIDQAIQRIAPDNCLIDNIKIVSKSGAAIEQQLERLLKSHRDARTIIAMRELYDDLNHDELRDQILTADRYCRQHRKQTLKVFFVMNTQSSWQWFQIPKSERDSIEERIDVVISLERWDRIGIRQIIGSRFFNEKEVQPTDQLLKEILKATNGWPYLVGELLFKRKFDADFPIETARKFTNELDQPDSEIAQEFLREIDISEELPKKLIQVMLKDEIAVVIQSDPNPVEILQLGFDDLGFKNIPANEIQSALDYLIRLGIVSLDNKMDPIMARLWKNA